MTWAQRMQTLVQLVYPPRCLSCGGLVESDFGLCSACWPDTPFIAGLTCEACGTALPGQSDHIELCDDCLETPRPWSQGRAALAYRGKGRRLVLALKHGDRHDIARPAARWMARVTRPILQPDTLIMPVPLHLHRHLRRRFNQAALLAEGLAQELNCDWCPDALQRALPTESLEGKTREERFAILSDSLQVTPAHADLIRGRAVLIVDDVMTSGATLSAATDACLAGGASTVSISVLARVVKDT
jgi:ComF family protein